MNCCLNFFLKFVLLNSILRFKIYAQFVDIDGTYDEYSSDQNGYNNNNNNNNHNYNGGDYNYNNDANGPTNFNGYWSSDGNGYGYGYYPETNCLYNYVPPYFMPYMDPGVSQILSNLTPMDLQSIFNPPSPSTEHHQNLLSQLQTQNPQLYKQLYNAYSELDPVIQQNVQSLVASVVPAIQHVVNTMNAQGAASTPLFNQNFPKLSNFLRSPGMTAFAQQPNPFLTSVAPQPSSVGQVPNNLVPNIINPIVQNPQAQQSQMSPNPTLGGVGGLVDGILNTVSTAIGMGGKKKK
uniref:Uncharacterized protein n=2 Tax=Globodera rostochiensis TaxID=31243 RepID=A0A914I0M8_GLORO